MTLAHLGLIGYGNIARTLMRLLSEHDLTRLDRVSVLCLPEMLDETRTAAGEDCAELAADVAVHAGIEPFLADRPDLVIECAGHRAVSDFATATLERGIETIVVSIGALCDADLHDRLIRAAESGGTRIVLPAGAIGGVDILAALKFSGVERVTYTSRKPPAAWAGTPAEDALDLASLTSEAVFFEGNAREAARDYPKNANVAATLALAGLGFERTDVRMIADPAISKNIHEYSVAAGAADYTIRIEGRPSPGNAKTSLTTVMSLAREVANRLGPVAI